MKRTVQKLMLIIFISIVSFFNINCPPPSAIYQVTGNKDIIIGRTMKKIIICDANNLKLISIFANRLAGLPLFVIEDKIYYVTAGNRQLSILDIDNPQNPFLIEQANTYKNIETMKVTRDNIYLIIKNRLIIVDLLNTKKILGEYQPRTLKEIHSLETDGKNYLYLDGGKKIEIVDISNIKNPRYLQTYEVSDYFGRMYGYNNMLYIRLDRILKVFTFNESKDLTIIHEYSDEDIINLRSFENPVLAKYHYSLKLRSYYGVLSTFVDGNYLYISKGGRIDKMDITDPYTPRVVASYVNE